MKALSPTHWTIRKFSARHLFLINFFFGSLGLLPEGFSLLGVQGLLIAVACPGCRAQALEHASPSTCGTQALHSTACRIFRDQGSNSVPALQKGILSHWTTRKPVPGTIMYFISDRPSRSRYYKHLTGKKKSSSSLNYGVGRSFRIISSSSPHC